MRVCVNKIKKDGLLNFAPVFSIDELYNAPPQSSEYVSRHNPYDSMGHSIPRIRLGLVSLDCRSVLRSVAIIGKRPTLRFHDRAVS